MNKASEWRASGTTVSVREAVLNISKSLQSVGIAEHLLEAELLLSTALGMDRAALYTSFNEDVPCSGMHTVDKLLEQRLTREPLPYILGCREFYGMSLVVKPSVFIPRPETEILVDEALRLAKQMPRPPKLRIVEVGTGCGAIAVALASHLGNADIQATDISRRALTTAEANAERHGLQNRIEFIHCDLLSCFLGPIDMLVANLPYVSSAAISSLEPEIRVFEPREALDGGDDGLHLIQRLLGEARRVLKGTGAILLEMDPHQMEAVEVTARSYWPSATTSRHKDLAGLDRVLSIRLSGC